MIETGNRNFWIAQIIGWGMMAGSNFLVQYSAGLPMKMLLMNSILPFATGFVVTTGARYFLKNRQWKNWSVSKLFLLIMASTLVQSILVVFTLFGIIGVFIDNEFEATPSTLLSHLTLFGVFILAWNLIYFFIHYFNNWHHSEIEKWQLVAEMKDAQLGALKSQINPHFIFNAINNIRSLILEDPDKARDMLLNFSDLFRYSLKHNDHAKVMLKEELEVVDQYLELLSIQFEDKLKYTMKVENHLLEKEIPPMILQILIENAVKHGVSQMKEGGVVEIEVHDGNGFIYLDVKNSGTLNSTTSLGEKLGVGLENIKRRLELMYNGKAKFDMSEANNFVTASIKIPLI